MTPERAEEVAREIVNGIIQDVLMGLSAKPGYKIQFNDVAWVDRIVQALGAQRRATPSAPDSASTPELGAPDGATAPGAGDDVTKRAHALLRSLIDTYTLELPWSQQAAALEIITDHLNDLAHAAPPAAGSREARLEAALRDCHEFLKHSGNQRAVLSGKFSTPSARYEWFKRVTSQAVAALAPAPEPRSGDQKG